MSDLPMRLDEMLIEYQISATGIPYRLIYKSYGGIISLVLMGMLRDSLIHQKGNS